MNYCSSFLDQWTEFSFCSGSWQGESQMQAMKNNLYHVICTPHLVNYINHITSTGCRFTNLCWHFKKKIKVRAFKPFSAGPNTVRSQGSPSFWRSELLLSYQFKSNVKSYQFETHFWNNKVSLLAFDSVIITCNYSKVMIYSPPVTATVTWTTKNHETFWISRIFVYLNLCLPAGRIPVVYSTVYPNTHTAALRTHQATHITYAEPQMRNHPQSDRQFGKHITGVSPQTHTYKHSTPHHLPMRFTRDHHRSRAVEPSFHRFLCNSTISCVLLNAISALQR